MAGDREDRASYGPRYHAVGTRGCGWRAVFWHLLGHPSCRECRSGTRDLTIHSRRATGTYRFDRCGEPAQTSSYILCECNHRSAELSRRRSFQLGKAGFADGPERHPVRRYAAVASQSLRWPPAVFWESTPTEFFDALLGAGNEVPQQESFTEFHERLMRAGVA